MPSVIKHSLFFKISLGREVSFPHLLGWEVSLLIGLVTTFNRMGNVFKYRTVHYMYLEGKWVNPAGPVAVPKYV